MRRIFATKRRHGNGAHLCSVCTSWAVVSPPAVMIRTVYSSQTEGTGPHPRGDGAHLCSVCTCETLARHFHVIYASIYLRGSNTTSTHSDYSSGAMQLLRLGIYEITQMGLAPHAVNAFVELAKRGIRPQAAGFVNGVLRTAMRHMDAGTMPLPVVPPVSTEPEARLYAS